ncbi:retrovirus-related pol polyprotein from transposon TNT 1-94 [Tanacetum coccineum]
MLVPGNYVQWKSRIKRYIDTKPNSELIHYCLQNLPYTYQWAEKTVPVAEGSSETTIERYMENYKNVSQDIRDQLNAEAEAVQIILTGIDNDIYSTVDACPNACEMWKAIERLKQGKSINVQDLETNLYWEFGKFTSRDGESLESYYSWFYKMMNELVRNQCHVTNHQVNVQFLLQLQPEWQSQTRKRGKAIVTSSAPTYDPEPATVTEDEEMSKEKEIDKLMALISLSFKKIYKPTGIGNSTLKSTGTHFRGTITIKRVYYVEGLNHNLFSVGQFCDADLEVAFRKSTCYIRDLKGNDLLTGSRMSTDLYPFLFKTQLLQSNLLKAKPTSSQAWLWHQGIRHETSTARTPEQNGVVERRNRTLVEAARTMLSAAKVPLFFWAEAIATACFTQKTVHNCNSSTLENTLIISSMPGNPVKFFHIVLELYATSSIGENLDKMKEKGRLCILLVFKLSQSHTGYLTIEPEL